MAALEARLGATETILAADFRGLTVSQLADLRRRLRAAEAEMTVVKNTLARRAAAASGREELLAFLEGPSGLVWASGDPAQAAKVLADFAREHQDRLSLKGGLLGPTTLTSEAVGALARLPPREQLLGQLAGGVAAPLAGLAGALTNLISGLARALAALQEQRGGDEAPSA